MLNEFKDLPRGKEGTFSLTCEAGTMDFTGKFEGDKGMGQYKFSPNKTIVMTCRKKVLILQKMMT
jgi:hypothetical protein